MQVLLCIVLNTNIDGFSRESLDIDSRNYLVVVKN